VSAPFTLVASRIKADKRNQMGVGTISLLAHVGIIAAVVYATAQAGGSVATVKTDTSMVFLAQPPAATPPALPELNAPLQGFQTLDVPTVIPTTIPPVNLTQHFDPRDYSGTGVEGGRADGAVPSAYGLATGLYTDAMVEEQPEPLSAAPKYPDAMRSLGIQGRVLLQAIIDTTGRVEPSSIRIVQSPNPGFDQTVRDWALTARFRPARLRGHPVRVVVSLPFDFSTAD
jgi:TonB family protein